MNIQKEEQYIIITPNKSTSFSDFNALFNEKINTLTKDNVILDFSNFNINLENLITYKTNSLNKMELGTSFVIIKSDIDLDKIPDELIIAPTLQEAMDIIDMDEMTRSLDF